MEDYKMGATRKFDKAVGNYYLLMLNIPEQRIFNGLPPVESSLVVLDDNIRDKAENKLDGYEMVFEVISIGDDCDQVPTEQGGVKRVPPIVNVGDIVLAKGAVLKVHAEPVMYAVQRHNIVALVKSAADRDNYSPVDSPPVVDADGQTLH